jgi:hypothetical protein
MQLHFAWSTVMQNWQFTENLVQVLTVRGETCPTFQVLEKRGFYVDTEDNYGH